MRTKHEGFGNCYKHGGNAWQHNKHAAKLQAAAHLEEIKQSFFEQEIAITPNDALMKELYRSEAMVEGIQKTIVRAHYAEGLDDAALLIKLSDDGIHEAAAFVKLFRDERDHLLKVINTCKVSGVLDAQERYIDLMADHVGNSIVKLLTTLGHDPTDPGVRAAARELLDDLIGARDEQLALEGKIIDG